MKNQTNANPYELEAGYEPQDDIPMTGYGITIESVYHWLYDHNLPTEDRGYQKAHPDDFDNVTGDDYDRFLTATISTNDLTYVQTVTAGVEALMMFDVRASTMVQTVPTQATLNQQIVKAIMAIYDVPTTLKDDLVTFVDQYADDISISDFC